MHASLQGDHLHLIAEAADRDALTRAMRGLTTRVAKALNKLWRRKGQVFADRFHDRVLRNPWQVFNALRYVLTNGRKHRSWIGRGPDPCSSGIAWDGWEDWTPPPGVTCEFVVPAEGWLLKVGWRKHHGRFKTTDVPTSATKPPSHAQLRKAERQRRRRYGAG